jgi:hypothetical protein
VFLRGEKLRMRTSLVAKNEKLSTNGLIASHDKTIQL